MSNIILAPPYSGSLYAFFNDCYGDRPHDASSTHPYYNRLYGMYTDMTKDIALTLCTVYDNIILTPADAYSPKQDLGIKTNEWENFKQLRENHKNEISIYLNDSVINSMLPYNDDWQKELHIEELLYCIYQSEELLCPVFCGNGSRNIMNRMNAIRNKSPIENAGAKNDFLGNYIELSGLTFDITDMDSFKAIKDNSQIRDYGDKFVKILDKAEGNRESLEETKNLIREAVHTDGILRHCKGIFEAGTLIFSIISLLGLSNPIIGVPSTIASLVATGAAKAIDNSRPNWYELSSKINYVRRNELLTQIL